MKATQDASPAFLFYVKDWRASQKVKAMSFAVKGMFLELLCEQWTEGSVPTSPEECAARFGGGSAAWKCAWKHLRPCFVEGKRDGRLINAKLKRIRDRRAAYLKTQRQSGLTGARKRWQAHSEPIGLPQSDDGEPVATPTHISKEKVSKEKVITPPTPSRGSVRDLRARFDAFWNAYPRKEGGAFAWRVWQQLHPDAALLAAMMAALAWQTRQDSWIRERGRFVPMPGKWLQERRWTDQPSSTPHISDRTIALARAGQEFLS